MVSDNPKTPCQIQNDPSGFPFLIICTGGVILVAFLGITRLQSISANPMAFQPFTRLLIEFGSIIFYIILSTRLAQHISKTRREARSREHRHVQIEARIIESRLHWYGSRTRGFVPAWSLNYEFEFDGVKYQSRDFQFDARGGLEFGSVSAVKRMVATYPEGSTTRGYFRSTAPIACGLSLNAVTLEETVKSYTEQECRQQEMLP